VPQQSKQASETQISQISQIKARIGFILSVPKSVKFVKSVFQTLACLLKIAKVLTFMM